MSRVLSVLAALMLVACSAAPDATSGPSPERSCTPGTIPPVPGEAPQSVVPPPVDLVTFAEGFTNPVGIANACDGTGRLFVLEKAGTIRVVRRDGTLLDRPFLDLSARTQNLGESGLLGLAFHPDYAANGRLFVYYVNREFVSVLAEYRASADDPDLADPSVEITHIRAEQPDRDHKGGQLAFGPDGFLYMGLGDGGGAFDEYGNGQNRDTLLSKVLRIDVDGTPYRIPSDNPWAEDGGVPETWMWGLRNPWRFSFDALNGDLYIADVGQGRYEEIDRVRAIDKAGMNFGWPSVEGIDCRLDDCEGLGFTAPILVYEHDPECAVVGGYVYRGAHPTLWGTYIYTDFCSGVIMGFDAAADVPEPVRMAESGRILSTFGLDEAGEIYVADFVDGAILRLRPSAGQQP